MKWISRIAVDFALIALAGLFMLALSSQRLQTSTPELRLNSYCFLAGYALFVPFILWWDPYEPKWFVIPNIFLAGFLACGLTPWLQRKRVRLAVLGCALSIAGANFITTVFPRHNALGPDRTIAECVAGKMQPRDVFIAAEWGWADYLTYLHSRTSINVINLSVGAGGKGGTLSLIKDRIAETQREGGNVYMLDPQGYSESHIRWLESQTGLTLGDLTHFAGSPAFSCSGATIEKLASAGLN